jgi:hypothetical protein
MLGYGDLLLLLGSAALVRALLCAAPRQRIVADGGCDRHAQLFGPKDVPRVARAAGRLAGRAVGSVANLRARVEAAAEGAVLTDVQRDLRDGLTQLNAIRDEIRTGISPLAPGCGACGREHLWHAGARALTHAASGRPLAQRALRLQREPADATRPQAAPLPESAAAAATAQPWSGGSASDGARSGHAPAPGAFPFLPVSAAALGRLPARRPGAAVTGGDIMMDAVAEEAVGTQAARLMSVPGALDAAAAAYKDAAGSSSGRAAPTREP